MLNLDYYKGEDRYSDGDVEEEILALVSGEDDLEAAVRRDNRWPILYHLSPERRNLLEWFPFRPEGSLLEVGAGCGALTGLFCERLRRVVAVELSRRRARIVEARHRRAADLAVYAGNVIDIPLRETFDYITLIGVLEYAGAFLAKPDPCRELLGALLPLLAEDGLLIVAIENRYGLKYWAGAADDHTGRPFDGIEGYPEKGGCETFSRDGLIDLLGRSGLADLEFYYPHPDYKLPQEVFSDAYLPGPGSFLADAPAFDREGFRLFDERRAFFHLVQEGRFPWFANAFLVTARREARP